MNAPAALLPPRPVLEAQSGSAWRPQLAALALVAASILMLFARDAGDMVAIWWTSSTYGHCLFVLPIIGWLVWQRRPELDALTARSWWPGLIVVGAGAFGWLLGDAAGVALVRHVGLVVMLQGAVAACLGPSVARGLLFPLVYAFFLVPAGEELVPPLQTLTARICMTLLGLAGVPAHIEGVFITTPNGWFEVAEACSGAKFLVAMIAYGALVANVCFRSWPRRIAFMAAAVVVPIVANGLRAWGTIYVAFLTTPDFATSFDHLVYGWIFFAVILALLMAAGWRFFDRRVGDRWFDPVRIEPVPPRRSANRYGVAATAIMLALAPLGWSAAIAATGRADLPDRIGLPVVPAWTRVSLNTGTPWRPHFADPDHSVIGRYSDSRGQLVDLAIIVYGSQAEGRELVGYGQGAVDPDGDWAWTDDRPAPPAGRAFRILAPGPVVREVVTFYRVGDVTTGSEARVKLETLKVRLLGGRQRAVAVLVSAEGRHARRAVDAFLVALGDIGALADRAATR